MKTLRILNLGAGVQSTTVLLMACKGILPKFDAAIFADTQWEPKEVYEHLAWLAGVSGAAGIPVLQVTAGNLREDSLAFLYDHKSQGRRAAMLPFFIKNPDGSRGKANRQCTSDYKVEIIEQTIRRQILGVKPGHRVPEGVQVIQAMGISSDEVRRARGRGDYWRQTQYPLCRIGDETLPAPMSRHDCLAWLGKYYPGRVVPRSACIGCPFHDDNEWLAIKAKPEQWADAVDFDHKAREADDRRIGETNALLGRRYLHDSLVPLDEVILKPRAVVDQVGFWREECLGMCGV